MAEGSDTLIDSIEGSNSLGRTPQFYLQAQTYDTKRAVKGSSILFKRAFKSLTLFKSLKRFRNSIKISVLK